MELPSFTQANGGLKHLETGGYHDRVCSFIHTLTTTNNEETCLQYFLVILKHPLQNYKKILKTTWTIIL